MSQFRNRYTLTKNWFEKVPNTVGLEATGKIISYFSKLSSLCRCPSLICSLGELGWPDVLKLVDGLGESIFQGSDLVQILRAVERVAVPVAVPGLKVLQRKKSKIYSYPIRLEILNKIFKILHTIKLKW